jgi:hypothetical protein
MYEHHYFCGDNGDTKHNNEDGGGGGDDDDDKSGNWNHFKILQKILEQHTRKARYQGTTENRYIGHSTHTAESANVEAQRSLILNTALHSPLIVRAE